MPTTRVTITARNALHAFGARHPFTLATVALVVGLVAGFLVG